jgi:hypothetical protein
MIVCGKNLQYSVFVVRSSTHDTFIDPVLVSHVKITTFTTICWRTRLATCHQVFNRYVYFSGAFRLDAYSVAYRASGGVSLRLVITFLRHSVNILPSNCHNYLGV